MTLQALRARLSSDFQPSALEIVKSNGDSYRPFKPYKASLAQAQAKPCPCLPPSIHLQAD